MITAADSIELDSQTKPIHLLKLRNLWATTSDWYGAWSYGSSEWSMISNEEKRESGLTLDHPGEFWMTFEDFNKNFTNLEICHINNEKLSQFKGKWNVADHNGSWQIGLTSGGCNPKGETYFRNPKFFLSITPNDCDYDNDLGNTNVIIGLMQTYRSSKKHSCYFDLKIGNMILRYFC